MHKIVGQLIQAKEDMELLRKTLGGLNKEVTDIYHIIELLPLNGGKLVQLTSKLKKVLIKRREVKEQITVLETVFLHSNTKLDIHSINDRKHKRSKKYTEEARQAYKGLIC